jgi:hypothetical protein
MFNFQWFDFARINKNKHTRRASSYSEKGDNRDRISLTRGETKTVLDVKGAGCITHMWFTPMSVEPHYLRKLLLRIYWDDEPEPSVLVPFGDFFGLGHAETENYSSLPMVMAPREGHGFNCYLPMPFQKSARIEIVSENFLSETRLYYNIDYELWDEPQTDLGYFHACWRRENPRKGVMETPEMSDYMITHYGINLSDKDNYLIMEAEGAGQYIGCNLNIHNLRVKKDVGNWYGEGDEMIFIDDDNEGDRWPPTLHGTGTEDYFNTAWGPDTKFYSPFFGLIKPGGKDFSGKISWYRWHLLDPVRFNRSIRVSIENGNANRRSDDYSSTAYWYQTEPHKTFGILPPEQRLPRADFPTIPIEE